MGRDPVRSAIGRPRGGRAGIGQRKGAGPPSGMCYGASGTSVRAGGARDSPQLPGGLAGDAEPARREASARASIPALPGPRGRGESGAPARARTGLPARRAGPALSHVAARAPPSPRLLPHSLHLGFFLSFLSSFFFNEHTPCAS